MRKSCLSCCYKHLAEAAIYETETRLGYPVYKFYVIGSLSHAAQEIYLLNPTLAFIIREHRINRDNDDNYIVPYEALASYLDTWRSLPDVASPPQIPESCYEGIEKDESGNYKLSFDTRPE